MSELRLYCDLLMQQVASVKEACEEREQPDVEVRVQTKQFTVHEYIM